MRSLILTGALGLVCILALALLLWSRSSNEESRVAAWAHSLIWEAAGLTVAPRAEADEVAEEDTGSAGGRSVWLVIGRLSSAELASDQTYSYQARLRQTCEDSRSRECWSLQDLTLGDTDLVRQGQVDPSARATLVPELAMPATVATEEPVANETMSPAPAAEPLPAADASTEAAVAEDPAASQVAEDAGAAPAENTELSNGVAPSDSEAEAAGSAGNLQGNDGGPPIPRRRP